MAFNVRVYEYPGIEQIPVVRARQYSADSVFQLVQPYINAQVISVSGTAASTAAQTDSRTNLVRIEVPDGEQIRYEINPPNREGGVRTADTQSPILSGHDQYYFRAGWTISMIDAAGLP